MSSTVFLVIFVISNLISFLVLLFAIFILLRPIVSGAVFYPTSDENAGIMLQLAGVKPNERAVDLGSGDGRIVIALARAGAEAHGYEINPFLVRKSRRAIQEAGLDKKALVHCRSFWRETFSSFDVVAVYGIPPIMGKLEKKLRRELKPGARVVSNTFQFPSWIPERSLGAVYLYVKH